MKSRVLLVLFAFLTALLPAAPAAAVDGSCPNNGGVGIDTTNGKWCMQGLYMNGTSSAASGLAMNFRAIQGIFEDHNAGTDQNFFYTSGDGSSSADGAADRNTSELVGQLDTYRGYGLDMITVGLQGGMPRYQCENVSEQRLWNASAYGAGGTLLSDAQTRLTDIVEEAWNGGTNPIVVNVQLFYQNQDRSDIEPNTDSERITAVTTAANFLEGLWDAGNKNITIEIVNEDLNETAYAGTALDPINLETRMEEVKAAWSGDAPLVSANLSGGGKYTPSQMNPAMTTTQKNNFQSEENFVSLHANGVPTPDLIDQIDAAQNDPQLEDKPVIVTEDSAEVVDLYESVQIGGTGIGAGWGYYEQGCEGPDNEIKTDDDVAYSTAEGTLYVEGFQSPPINWSPTSTPDKLAFFNAVKDVTGQSGGTSEITITRVLSEADSTAATTFAKQTVSLAAGKVYAVFVITTDTSVDPESPAVTAGTATFTKDGPGTEYKSSGTDQQRLDVYRVAPGSSTSGALTFTYTTQQGSVTYVFVELDNVDTSSPFVQTRTTSGPTTDTVPITVTLTNTTAGASGNRTIAAFAHRDDEVTNAGEAGWLEEDNPFAANPVRSLLVESRLDAWDASSQATWDTSDGGSVWGAIMLELKAD